MENQEEKFYEIEDYVRGKLSEKEKKSFEQKMKQSPALAEEVEKHRNELEGLEYILEKDLRTKMEDWKPTPPIKKRHYFWWIPILLIIVMAFLWIFSRLEEKQETPVFPTMPEKESLPPPNKTEQEQKTEIPITRPPVAREEPKVTPGLAEPSLPSQKNYLAIAESAYSLPEHLSNTLKSSEIEESAPTNFFDEGIQAFLTGEYTKALAAFQKIKPEDDNERYEQAYEWMAHIHFRQREFESAADKFRNIVNSEYSPFINDRAEWYLLLSLLPNYTDHKHEIEDLIKKMTNPENYHLYEASARAISNQLHE